MRKDGTVTSRSSGALGALCLAAMLLAGAPARADGHAGGYLAGRHAMLANDFPAAARYFARALVREPKDVELMLLLQKAYIGSADIDRALAVARRLEALGIDSWWAALLLMVEALDKGEYAVALEKIKTSEHRKLLLVGLGKGWALVGLGRMNQALEIFDEVETQLGGAGIGKYHKALALMMAGDLEGAERLLAETGGKRLAPSWRQALAHVEILSQLGRYRDAYDHFAKVFGTSSEPMVKAVRTRLEAGEPLPFTVATTPAEGMAEALFDLTLLTKSNGLRENALLYSRLAEYLSPGNIEAILISAEILEDMGRYDLAVDVYAQVPREDLLFLEAELGRTRALHNSGMAEEATEALERLARSFPDQFSVHKALGDSYRLREKYAEAAEAYDRAIALLDSPGRKEWSLFYLRGISYERIGEWDRAEADFRKALELEPDQPEVLNYFGYSLVELRRNLDEALEMISRAADARPDDGYTIDSLGWVLYRLGRYPEAVEHLERAAELLSVDPIVADHLGDAYWAVGRRREARFQWRRALSFGPEEEEAERIRRKLEIGLDAVLEEEGAPPLSLADGN